MDCVLALQDLPEKVTAADLIIGPCEVMKNGIIKTLRRAAGDGARPGTRGVAPKGVGPATA
jgi:hypothetical protein